MRKCRKTGLTAWRVIEFAPLEYYVKKQYTENLYCQEKTEEHQLPLFET